MKWIVIILVAAWAISSGVQFYVEEGRQEARNAEQTKILVELENMNNQHVSQFVKDWRNENKEPSAEALTTLKITQAKIQKSPNDASQFTTAEKQKGIDKIESVVSGAGHLFGGVKAKAGAD